MIIHRFLLLPRRHVCINIPSDAYCSPRRLETGPAERRRQPRQESQGRRRWRHRDGRHRCVLEIEVVAAAAGIVAFGERTALRRCIIAEIDRGLRRFRLGNAAGPCIPRLPRLEVEGADLKGESFKKDQYLPVSMSQKLDEGVLSRFWASLNQPMKPAIQCWTTVPIYPSGEVEIRRVQEKDVRFFDLNKLNRVKR